MADVVIVVHTVEESTACVDIETVKGKVDLEHIGELTGIVVEVFYTADVNRSGEPVVFQH